MTDGLGDAMDRFLVRSAAEPVTFEEHFERLFRECLDVMVERQRKYGPNNIPKFGTFGTLVRMGDKFERLLHLQKHSELEVAIGVDESVEDTLIDIANYATIMRAQLRGIWTADQCPPLMNYQEEPSPGLCQCSRCREARRLKAESSDPVHCAICDGPCMYHQGEIRERS